MGEYCVVLILRKNLLLFIFLILFLLGNLSGFAQKPKKIRYLDSLYYTSKIDSLKKEFVGIDKIPQKFELPILTALSFFPELKQNSISFKEQKIKATLNARPKIFSLLFNKKDKRKYVVRINNKPKENAVTLTGNKVPFNALVGLFGHEFCHFVDYKNNNIFGIFKRLLAYTNKKGKEKFEKEIDSMTIERGLGWQAYDWMFYVLNYSNATEKYKHYKRKIYLEPHEIKQKIELY